MSNRREILIAVVAVDAALLPRAVAGLDTPMTPETSAKTLRDWFADRGLQLESLAVRALATEMLAFYQATPCAGLAADPTADMLLYQWGVFNWGKGERFEFDNTRQFILRGVRGEAATSQLRLTAYFPPTKRLHDIASGNQWCEGVNQLESLRSFMLESPAYRVVAESKAERVVIAWAPA